MFFMNHVVHITFMLRILFQKSSGFLWKIRVFIKQKKSVIDFCFEIFNIFEISFLSLQVLMLNIYSCKYNTKLKIFIS